MDASTYFRDKKVTIMGLGLLGGVGDIAYVAECGADIIATDLKSETELAPSLAVLKKYTNIRYTLGRHELADFSHRDLIIKAPSTPLDSPYIAEARKHGIEITMWAALFAGFAQAVGSTIVGVTGTRGKSTITAMISAILRGAGKHVIEGGNVRGTAVLPQLCDLTPESVAVLELDSWKLQGFGEAKMSPDIAVFTTLFQDHLNYYKDNLDQYLADKANIFLYQSEDDTLVLGKQCAPIIIDRFGEQIESTTLVVDETKLPDTWMLRIPGMHNRYNAALALAASRALSIPDEVSREALAGFMGVPGRLELIAEKKGVKIYNDNNSTTPDATIAALRAVGDSVDKRLILIMGGDEKNIDMANLVAEIPQWCKAVVLFKERGTDRIRDDVFALAGSDLAIFEEEGLQATVDRAVALAAPGDTILYSPAFSSFGKYFKNEYDRGDQFVTIVNAL